ncbi:MAG: hypothetical protein KatS3mg057_2443 [Herpetosiphonaceae bacterium]|nr:MAG: hypothetical protein KatS3mg057_2443 [Herpetosiphonaceae bacterium]
MIRYLATLLLSVMLIGLLFIYLVSPPETQQTVAIVSVLILAFGMFLGYAGDPRQREDALRILAIMTGVITIISAALVGNAIFKNPAAAFCLPILLILVVAGGFYLYLRRAVHVEDGDILVVDRRVGGGNYALPAGIYRPLIPGIEEAAAMLPSYELTTTVEVEQVDTHLLFKPELITLFVRYRIRELTAIEREELQQAFEEALQRAKGGERSREAVLERLLRRSRDLNRSQMQIERQEWEKHLVGDAPMSQEELADRRVYLEEALLERSEAQEDAWQLFFQPFASYLRLVYHFPNRDVALADLAREWNEDLAVVRLRSEFWTELIRRQIADELDEVVRETVHHARGLVLRDGKPVFNDDGSPRWSYYGPVEVSERRRELADIFWVRLQRRVRHWGIQILDLDVEQVKLHQSSVEFKYRPLFESVKTQEALEEARRAADRIRITGEAEAEHIAQHVRSMAEAEAEALAKMVEMLAAEIREAGTLLTEADIRRIIFEVLEEQRRLQYRVGIYRPDGS